MYRINMLKNNQLPDLNHDHVILKVHLDPQDGLERLQNHKIGLITCVLSRDEDPVLAKIPDPELCTFFFVFILLVSDVP